MQNLALLFFVFSGFQLCLAAELTEFESKDLKAISISALEGKISLQADDGPKASVSVTKNKFSEHCKLSIENKEHKLQIKVEKSPRFFSLEDCDVNFEIKMPKKSDADIKLGSGALTVKGLEGELRYEIGSGEVKADGNFTSLNGKSGSGPVSITGLNGGGTLKSGSGALNITFENKPAKGNLDIQSGAGDTSLSLPKGSKIKTSFIAGSGKLTNDLGDSADAGYMISVKTGSGNLKIKSH
jgi:DUF4097 and DUF4098 domain-containing protein YvlB